MPKPNKVVVEYVGEEAAAVVGESSCLPRLVLGGFALVIILLVVLGWLEQAGVI